MNKYSDSWHARCSIGRSTVLLKADIRRASDALHSSTRVKLFGFLAVNVVCIEHGI